MENNFLFLLSKRYKCNVMCSAQMKIKSNVAFKQMFCGLLQMSTSINAGTDQHEPWVTHTRKI